MFTEIAATEISKINILNIFIRLNVGYLYKKYILIITNCI